METKKIIKYALGVILVIVFVGLLLQDNGKKSIYKKCASKQIMTLASPATETSPVNIRNVDVYMDFSGSMRGYVDFSGHNDCRAIMKAIICDAMTMFDDKYKVVSHAHCGNKCYNQQECSNALSSRSIFNQGTTMLDEMIGTACKNITDSGVVVIVSDMILSYGKSKLLQEKDTFYNKNHLADLGSKILNISTELADKQYHVAILQYLSDYNGKYYCNYTENLKPIKCRTEILRDRPFYVMIIGSEANIVDVMEKDIFGVSEKPHHIYSTIKSNFKNYSPKSTFESESECWTFMEGKNDSSDVVCFSLQSQNLDNAQSKITIMYDAKTIAAPSYIDQELVVNVDTNIFKASSFLDQNAGMINLTLREYDELSDKNTTTILLESSNRWVEESNIDDDVQVASKGLSCKTWGLKTLVDNISKAYRVESQTPVARINILLTK